jgi:hypothetical protein
LDGLTVEERDPTEVELGVTRVLTEHGWEESMYVDPDDDWRLVDDGSWEAPDGRTRTWLVAGPEQVE